MAPIRSIDNSYMTQPSAHIDGTAVSYTGGKYKITHNSEQAYAQAVLLKTGGTDNTLRVHLVNDPPGTYYDIPLVNGDPAQAYIFDEIIETGTTVLLDTDLIIFVVK